MYQIAYSKENRFWKFAFLTLSGITKASTLFVQNGTFVEMLRLQYV